MKHIKTNCNKCSISKNFRTLQYIDSEMSMHCEKKLKFHPTFVYFEELQSLLNQNRTYRNSKIFYVKIIFLLLLLCNNKEILSIWCFLSHLKDYYINYKKKKKTVKSHFKNLFSA